jgi:hypothetical protein
MGKKLLKLSFLLFLLVFILCVYLHLFETAKGPDLIANEIEKKYSNCLTKYSSCADLFAVDCGSPIDGLLYFVSGNTGQIVSKCGGACWRNPNSDCKKGLCPPLRGRMCQLILGRKILNPL